MNKKIGKALALISGGLLFLAGCNPTVSLEWKLSFDSDGGSEVAAIMVKDGEKAEKPADPTKEGYDFSAWYEGDTAFDWDAPVNADHNLKAVWGPKKYSITFDSDGGSDVTAVSVEYNTAATKPADPVKEVYYFAGWYAGEAAYDWTSLVTENVSLKAKWNLHTYKITYELDGGALIDGETYPEGYTIESEDISIPRAKAPAGKYWFKWVEKDAEGNDVDSDKIEKGSKGDKVFYAKYSDTLMITVKFENSSVKSQSLNVGSKITKPADPTKENSRFAGWYADAECKTAFDFEKTTVTGTEENPEMKIYAKWVDQVTVTFEGVAGDKGKVAVDKDTVIPADKIPAVPEKAGYEADGWDFDKTAKVTTNITVKAKYKVIEYTITYYDGTEEITGLTPVKYTIESADFELPTITKDDYVFEGWYSDEALTTQVVKIVKGSTGNKVYYAKGISYNPSNLMASIVSPVKEGELRTLPYAIIKDLAKKDPKGTLIVTAEGGAVGTGAGWGLGGFYIYYGNEGSATVLELSATEAGENKTTTATIPLAEIIHIVDINDKSVEKISINVYNGYDITDIKVGTGATETYWPDLTTLTGYSVEEKGVVFTTEDMTTEYMTIFQFTPDELGVDTTKFVNVEVILDVYNKDGTAVNLNEKWGERVTLNAHTTVDEFWSHNVTGAANYNAGVAGQFSSWTSNDEVKLITIQRKNGDAVNDTKFVLRDMKFTVAAAE